MTSPTEDRPNETTGATPIGFIDCPTGSWWAHDRHPADQHDAVPAAWVDGDPLMESIAAAVWEHCETEGTSLIVDDPRTIAATAAAVARASSSAPADRAALRERAAQAIRDSNGTPEALAWWKAHPQLIPAHVYADAVLAVLPAPADRAAILREAATAIHVRATTLAPPVADRYASGLSRAASELRRMADEAQQPAARTDVDPRSTR
jgi:hypothetical protein